MDNYREKADTLAKRFGISPIEAMKALEECDGDILDAVALLECKGIIKRTSASYRSDRGSVGFNIQGADNDRMHRTSENRGYGFDSSNSQSRSTGKSIKDALLNLLYMSIEIKVTVVKNGKKIISIPVIAVIALLIGAFWLVVPIAVICFFSGCRIEITK